MIKLEAFSVGNFVSKEIFGKVREAFIVDGIGSKGQSMSIFGKTIGAGTGDVFNETKHIMVKYNPDVI
jgi:hypothetical protein